MKKRLLKKVHNFVLKAITDVALIGFVVGGLAIDSNTPLAIAICAVCLMWLALFTYANGMWYDVGGEEDADE